MLPDVGYVEWAVAICSIKVLGTKKLQYWIFLTSYPKCFLLIEISWYFVIKAPGAVHRDETKFLPTYHTPHPGHEHPQASKDCGDSEFISSVIF